MYLEKLEIQGFKSFASKNSLAFPAPEKEQKGITVIVGPNGSGKSNAADAIRWVLGEQSMKTIRAKTAEDVIFSGSSSKGQLGMAEVSLHLNNEDKQAPIDYSQLVITRRIFRDGESEYLLNNSKVRLVDIQILLAKANVGQKTYSVIGQGMVESFLATTATERKEFFDEATGVRQFQIKREQSINKLIASYENLGQANMLLSEIEPRLKSLTRQVNKLKQKGEIEQQLKLLRTVYFQHVWHKLNDRFKDFNGRYLQLEESLRRKNDELSSLNEELSRMENDANNSEYENLNSSAGQLQRRREDVLKKLATVEAQISMELESSGNFDLSWLTNKEAELRLEMERLEGELKILSTKIQDKKNESSFFNEEKSVINAKIEGLNRKFAEVSSGKKTDDRREQDINGKLSEIKVLLEELEAQGDIERVRELLIKIKALLREIMEIRGVDEESTESLVAEQKKIQEELMSLAKQKEDSLSRESEFRINLSSLEQKNFLLKEDLEKKQAELSHIREKIASTQKPKENLDLADKKGQIEAELKNVDTELSGIKERLSSLNREAEEKRSRLFRIQRESQSLQGEINRLSNELGSVKIDSAKYETRLEDLESEIRKVADNLKEIRENKPQNEIAEEETESNIRQLENQFNLIGGIDPEIEKEYEEIKQKYDFLHGQVSDLEEAIGHLEGIIRQLDGEIKNRFDKEFKEICSKFEEYFKILFSGGTAKIVALREDEIDKDDKAKVEGENTDELKEKIKKLSKYNATGLAGIEIQACPPGKAIKSITMLSGGEKALTAIALICAIISANPSPFVVLDEVDAALDEANSERLARILEDLSHKTQFIVITHNRAPMHRANILYGVTMQDSGISKLLSIKLEDYIKK
jgi:chromosome segregation protein